MTREENNYLQTLLPALTLGLLTAAFIIAKTGRDALFFQGSGGLLQLPLVYLNIAAASLPLALIFVKTMKVCGARPARMGILLLAAAAGANMGSKGNANFFANFYILLNFSSLLLQLFATPKIQDKVGLRGGLMVLPLALIGGATFVTAAATALSRSVLRVTEGGLRSSVHRSIWEQAFIPVNSTDRSSVKIVVDSIAARIAEAIGAVAILIWLKQAAADGTLPMPVNTTWMAWVTLATVAAWLLITQRMRVQVRKERGETKATKRPEIECERFPDQCPCTTELGRGVA